MQPEPLPQPEENKPEVPSTNEAPAPVPAPMPAPIVAPAPVPAPMPAPVAAPAPAPVQVRKASRGFPIFTILGILLTLVLFVATVGLGYWAYTLNTKLTDTQQQLTTLQGEQTKLKADYATLQGEKDKLSKDLDQTKADLDKANTELATTKSDLDKANTKITELTAKIEKVSKLAEVLYAWNVADEPSDILVIDKLVDDTNNSELAQRWKNLTNSFTDKNYSDFIDYLISQIRIGLK